MAPKKKQRECCSHSQTHLRFNCPRKLLKNILPKCFDYSEIMLHRLRPRIRRSTRRSEMAYKVTPPKTAERIKNRRLYVKRCCVQYKKKHRFQGNRSPRIAPSQKAAGDFRPGIVPVRPTQILETAGLRNLQYDKNHRKPTPFIQLIKDYIFSTIREGTRWAKNYVYQAFSSENKSSTITAASGERKEERSEISSSSSSHIMKPGHIDYKDKTRKRYKTVGNNQRYDGVGKSNGNAVTSRGYAGISSFENPGNLPGASNGKHRHCISSSGSKVITNITATTVCSEANDRNGNGVNKRGQTRSQRSIKKRRKRFRSDKRIARDIMRYKKVAKKIRNRNSRVGRSNSCSSLTNSMKPNKDMKVERAVDCANDADDNSEQNTKKIQIVEKSNRWISDLDQSPATPEMDRRKASKEVEFSKRLTENESLEIKY